MAPSLENGYDETVQAVQKPQSVVTKTTNGLSNGTRKNPSLQVTAEHTIKLVDAPVQAPGPGEVLLHVKCTGICGYVWKTLHSL